MTNTVKVAAYFERQDTTSSGFPGAGYVAGVRGENSSIGAEITLPADLVEQAVLASARLAVTLSPDGRVALESDHVSDDVLEAAKAASGSKDVTLESLIAACLPLELLQGEDDPVGDLTALRGQLVRALEQLDGTLEQLQRARPRES